MKNLTQLIQEQKHKLEKDIYINLYDGQIESYWDNSVKKIIDDQSDMVCAIIRNEIERKKGMIKPSEPWDEFDEGYNTALNEDIAYLQNVLDEIEKNV